MKAFLKKVSQGLCLFLNVLTYVKNPENYVLAHPSKHDRFFFV